MTFAQAGSQTGSLQGGYALHTLIQPRHGQQLTEKLVGLCILTVLRLHLSNGQQRRLCNGGLHALDFLKAAE